MEIDWVKITAIISLTAICIAALHEGINSTLVGTVCGIIGAIAGYAVRRLQGRAKGEA